MGGRDRKFFSYAVNHIYQNTKDGINIFYSVEDYLVYFTIFSNSMAKYGITVYGLCLMYDHIHALLSVREQSSLYKSVGETTSRFVKEYNIEYSRKGPLFNSPFGSAVQQYPICIIIQWKRNYAVGQNSIGGASLHILILHHPFLRSGLAVSLLLNCSNQKRK